MTTKIQEYFFALHTQAPEVIRQTLCIKLGQTDSATHYVIHSNSPKLLENLQIYFGRLATIQTRVEKTSTTQTTEFFLYQTENDSAVQAFIQKTPWQDWTREAGKSGRKDVVFDLDLAQECEDKTLQETLRLLYKVKTGVLFVQPATPNSAVNCSAFGDIEQHPNQMINFILTQYLNQHLRQNWLLGHAAGLQIDGKGLAIAGLSGGGKSTLMLQLLENAEHFISNDRLLFSPTNSGDISLRGIPKQPRINPGTIVHNPRLHSLMSESQRATFLAMPSEELRALEQKYDAMVDELYWENCYQAQTGLEYLVILNWSALSTQATTLAQTTLSDSPHLIPALMKSPGPFYSDAQGVFLKNGIIPNPQDYVDLLGEIPVLELNGKVDFAIAKQLVLAALNEKKPA